MLCPACSRPVAVVRPRCVYCGAALPEELVEAASAAAQKVRESTSLLSLEATATSLVREQSPRRYVVIDTAAASVERLAEACSVSVWEARQWQASSRFRLLRISTEPAGGPFEAGLREKGLAPLVVAEETISQSRNPILIESIQPDAAPLVCTFRENPEAPPTRRDLLESDLSLIISAPIRRERVKAGPPAGKRPDTRLEDAWLVHLHLKGGSRPWEIDPFRTAYEGVGVASAFMNTLDLVRRLSKVAPHDESFRNIVPALSPGTDPGRDLEALASAARKKEKEPKVLLLDNVAQFREYSGWRGAVEALAREGAGTKG